MKLESSVGQKLVAKNKREDVLTTQKLLNGLVIDKAGYKGMPAILGRAESFFTRDGGLRGYRRRSGRGSPGSKGRSERGKLWLRLH